MRKLFVLLTCFLLFVSSACASTTPKKIYGMPENDFVLDKMLPNPNIYLYGVDSNGFPILLFNFSSTVPFYAITDDSKLIKKILPFYRKKISSLNFVSLYLKLLPLEKAPNGKNFYYKILKLQCREVNQGIAYEDQNTFKIHLEPKYKEQSAGYTEDEYKNKANYTAERPIITYSGIGSDTLKIMLKRGRKYRIPQGHIDVIMLVMAVPNYTPQLNNCNLQCNNYLEDFLDQVELKNKCGESCCLHTIRKIYFGKLYVDNRLKSYYEVNPSLNPNNLLIWSDVIKGSRVNQVFASSLDTTCTNTIVCPPVQSKNTVKSENACCCCEKCQNKQDLPKETKTVEESVYKSCQQSCVLDDSDFMYDKIIEHQSLNTEFKLTPFMPK